MEKSKRNKKPVINITHLKNGSIKFKVICPKCSNIIRFNKKKETISRENSFDQECSKCGHKLNFSA